jgi:hypothetical protein
MDEQNQNFGGGSGGGMGPSDGASACGTYQIQANQVELISQPPLPPTDPQPCLITVLAAGLIPGDGRVEIRGTQGVRITTGPVEVPPASSEETNGVEVICAEDQTVTISCGGIPGESPTILVSADGIIISTGAAPLTLTSMTEITLTAADGVATVSLTPEGVTIDGPLVTINGA